VRKFQHAQKVDSVTDSKRLPM